MGNLKIGIVIADVDEYRPFEDKMLAYSPKEYNPFGKKGITFTFGNAQVYCLLSGIGKVNAAAAAMHLCDIGCNYVLNFGLSGGISGVRRGQLCIPTRFLEHDFDLTGIGYKPCEKPNQKYIYDVDEGLLKILNDVFPDAKCGTAVCGDRFVCSDADRTFLKETFGAVSCDMETAAIASVCDMVGVKFASLRRISDDAGDDALESYREMNICDGAVLSDSFTKFLEKVSTLTEA